MYKLRRDRVSINNIQPNQYVSAERAIELEQKIRQTLQFYYNRARLLFPKYTRPIPTLEFDLRGQIGGQAFYHKNAIKVNVILYHENEQKYLHSTVPHELCHIVTDSLYGSHLAPHGPEWKHVMRTMGQDPKRCHSYDVTNASVRNKRTETTYCLGCGTKIMLTKRQFLNIQTLTTRCCRMRLSVKSKEERVLEAKIAGLISNRLHKSTNSILVDIMLECKLNNTQLARVYYDRIRPNVETYFRSNV